MKVAYADSLKCKILQRIECLPYTVVLRSDLKDLSDYRQITSILNQLIQEEKIVRIGYGIYAKLKWSERFQESYLENGFGSVIREALTRLHVKWKPSKAFEDYNAGKTTQVPANAVFRIESGFRRKLFFDNITLIREPLR